MAVNLNDLTGPERRIVRDALLTAFNEAALDMLLQDELDKRLDEFVGDGPFRKRVFDLVNESQRDGWTDQLVKAAEQVSKNARIAQLRHAIDTYQSAKLEAVEAEVQKRVPASGGLERMVRASAFADWGLWVARMGEIGRQICRIEFQVGANMGGGTGFLVGSDLVLTNYHVIEKQQKAVLMPGDITCRFDFGLGIGGTQTPVKLAVDWLVDFGVYSAHDPGDQNGLPEPEALDYALLRLERSLNEDSVGSGKRGFIQLKADITLPKPGVIIFIGQHPKLEPLKLAVGAVLMVNANGTRVRYDANTEPGSSGSPCLDVGLNVVALHHGGDPDHPDLIGKFNQGIPVPRILARMKTRGVTSFWS
jgi:hypothetical protein